MHLQVQTAKSISLAVAVCHVVSLAFDSNFIKKWIEKLRTPSDTQIKVLILYVLELILCF
jgi:hypothetical protein